MTCRRRCRPAARGGAPVVRAAAGRQGRRRDGAQPAFPRLHPAGRRADPGRGGLARADRYRTRTPARSVAPASRTTCGCRARISGRRRCPSCPGSSTSGTPRCRAVARTLLRHWAASLGSPPDVFDAAFADAPATLIKIIRYPARAASPQGVGAHRDSGVLTLLLAEPGSRGLQVRRAQGGDADDRAGSTCRRWTGRSSSTSASCSRSRRAATCGPPSTG